MKLFYNINNDNVLVNFKLFEMIELYTLNPNWQLADKHGEASKAGIVVWESHFHQMELCPCCYRNIQQKPYPLCCHSKELYPLGFGFPLLYEFFKYCGFALIITIFSYTFPCLYFAIIEECPIIEDDHRRLLAS